MNNDDDESSDVNVLGISFLIIVGSMIGSRMEWLCYLLRDPS